ncbi:LuxR C-terminal-related transcriptional regulator [Streptosporangium sp. NPDC000396]|uniref:LuxR C-terminal-related transcriptional regulator n=1 Tax=Streptosporangium sp. NPDC000396 TaxID=3366185 RepID=UPI0036A26EFE
MVFVDDELLRLGLETLLPTLSLRIKVRYFNDVEQVRHALELSTVNVVLATPDSLAGVTLTRADPGVAAPRTLLLIDERELEAGFDVAASPADGYLIRQTLKADTLERALMQLSSGEMPLPAGLGRMLISRGAGFPFGSARLTFREQEALTHLASGMSNRQIATRMRISEHGAKRLVSSLLLKLSASNRTAAVVTAIKYGLVRETTPSRP